MEEEVPDKRDRGQASSRGSGGMPSDNRILPTGPRRRHAATSHCPRCLEDGREEEGADLGPEHRRWSRKTWLLSTLYPGTSALTFDGPE